jgi:two-component system chemotaxis response regulator CheB
MEKLKALVVDDTIVYRKIISDILNELPDVEVVGTAENGELALGRIRTLKPDFLTLDVEMPVMNGLQLLAAIQAQKLAVDCVMVSSKTQSGSQATIQALELGAFDFLSKPDEGGSTAGRAQLKKDMGLILLALKRRKEMLQRFRTMPLALKKDTSSPPVQLKTMPLRRTEKSKAIAIGISTGGPNALARMLPMLPDNLGVPIFIVQHMPPLFTASLAQSLDKGCKLTVKEAENGEEVKNNTIYIAPGGRQMKVANINGMTRIIRITDDPPENNCRPSADYLFRSAGREYGSQLTCIVMTGMGSDGKLGVSVTKAGGAAIIAQDEASSIVYGMPKSIVDAGLADVVVPLDRIADELVKTLR